MITLPRPLLRQIEAAAEATYPHECCGLLLGHDRTVTRIAESPNVSNGNKATRFEISPQLRIDVMRQIEGSGEAIIGHYHSHPDKPATPSKYDQAMIFEPNLIWIITAVINGKAAETKVYVLDHKEKFLETQISQSG